MNAIYLTLFVSLILVGGAGLLFAYSFTRRDHDHATRLSLLPLFDGEGEGAPVPAMTSMTGMPGRPGDHAAAPR